MGLNLKHRRVRDASTTDPYDKFGFHKDPASRDDPGELVQTCASVPPRNLEYLLLKIYDEKEYEILALGCMEM